MLVNLIVMWTLVSNIHSLEPTTNGCKIKLNSATNHHTTRVVDNVTCGELVGIINDQILR